MLYFETNSAIMHHEMFLLIPQLGIFVGFFIHSSDVHAYNTRFSSAKKFYIQESRLRVKLKSFSAFAARLWNCCLHPDLRKLTKIFFKRNFINY